MEISAQPHCDSESSSWDHSQETQNPKQKTPDSTLHPHAATPPVWFLREQFFPQTLPSIIRTQLPLVLLHFGMLPMIWFLAKLQNCALSQGSGLWSGSRISCDVGTSGAARVLQEGWSSTRPCAPLLARLGKLIRTLLNPPGWLWITSPDQNLHFSHLLSASAGHPSGFSQGGALTMSANTVTTRVSAHQPP